MDFVIAGTAAMAAGVFTNPLDVIKTRMQLQGELQKKGNYKLHYKNVFHAGYTIAKHDGILALQKGFVPAIAFQLVGNSARLGLYQTADSHKLTKNENGETDALKSMFFGSASGVTGAFLGSPFYLIKTQFQSHSVGTIAVGYQHNYNGTVDAFRIILKNEGIKGLWRGVESALPRVGIGSAVQLSTFNRSKDILRREFNESLLDKPILTAFIASNISGITLAMFMCPFDVISTRLYNQEVDKLGKGKNYNGVIDCAIKIVKSEGFLGFYKGVVPFYLRVAPHTILSLIFWDLFKDLYVNYNSNNTYK